MVGYVKDIGVVNPFGAEAWALLEDISGLGFERVILESDAANLVIW